MLNACTIIALNYRPYARVLADSFFAQHPTGAFTVLLIDDEQRQLRSDDDRTTWMRLSDLGLDPTEIRRLAGIYDVTELATAVKPLLLRRLLDEGCSEVIYLDPDIRIYDSLEEIGQLAHHYQAVLTPHTMQPFPRDGRRVDGFFILSAGVYNLGFIGVGQASRPFLDWWWQATRREALVDVARMMFTDQRLVDFVPSFFEHHILKDPGSNVAYWNLHGRHLTFDGQRHRVDGLPLRFFHFSGFDVRRPWLLSKYQGDRPRILLSERPVLAGLCDEYARLVQEAGATPATGPSYGWGTLASGVEITTRMRRLYWKALVAAEKSGGQEPPNPFDESDREAFLAWLNTPDETGPSQISRYLYSIYHDRIDLQVHFRDIHGADAAHFVDWIWHQGIEPETIPLELLPARPLRADSSQHPVTPALSPGVNLAGYFRAELGIGEAARLLASAVEAASIPHSTTTYDATLNRQLHVFTDRPTGGAAYDINVLCVNADCTPRFARDMGTAFFAGRYTIGYWFWEIEEFPPTMHAAFDVVDEVWAATDFVADAIRAAGHKRVFTIPLPLTAPRSSGDVPRERLGVPDTFVFLSSFDFLSVAERKNPLGLVEAFTRAFRPGEGPVLVLKSINGDLRLNDLERLRAVAADRPDIRIIDGYYSADDKDALAGMCDCYVSLHRSEGLGLTLAEAMALGKPVIATGYSGNLHFMTTENSYLVDYAAASVPTGCDPYPEGARWAAPDLDQAARYMRQVYDRPDEARARGRQGQRDILTHHGLQVSAAAVADRLRSIRTDRAGRIVDPHLLVPKEESMSLGSSPAPGRDEIEPLETLLPHLEQSAALRVGAAGGPLSGLRLAAQRMLFRVLRPYWFQQQQFHMYLITGLRRVAAAMRDEQQRREVLDARVRQLTREVMSCKREIRRLEGERSEPEATAGERSGQT